METLPIFNNYKAENSDSGYEALQDFFLSWTLRCSPDDYKTADATVQEYARRIVYALIHGKNQVDTYALFEQIPDNFLVKQVETKRQLSRIDLLAEVTTCENGFEKQYVLNIENKWYSNLNPDQLKKYDAHVRENYTGFEQINLLITCDDCRKNMKDEKTICKEFNYKYVSIDRLKELTAMFEEGETGNALFDAYWFFK